MAEVFRITATDATKPAFDSVQRSLTGLVTSASRITGVLGGLTAGFGFQQIVSETLKAERSMKSLEQTVRTTGYAAGLTSRDLEKLAGSFSKTSLFDDDEIRDGIVALLRFRDISKDVFGKATQAAVDFAAATGRDVVSSAQAIGRALQDPVGGARALREVGIRLSDSQAELAQKFIDTGESAKAQQLILAELAKSIGGAAAGQNSGLTGATRSLGKAFDDLWKTAGRMGDTGRIVAGIDAVTAAISKFDESLQKAGSRDLTSLLGAPGGALFGIGARLAAGDGKPRNSATGIVRGGPADEDFQARLGAEQARIDRLTDAETAREKKRREELAKSAKAAKAAAQEREREQVALAQEIGRQTREEADDRAAVASTLFRVETERATRAQEELNRIIADTPTAKLVELERRQGVVNEALIEGRIGVKQFNEAFAAISEQRENALGRTAGDLERIGDSGKKVFQELEFAVQRWGRSASDTFAEIVVTGKASWSDLYQSILKDLISLTVYQSVTKPLVNVLSGVIGGAIGGAFGAGGKGFFAGSANGNVFGPQGLVPFANGGLVTRPTIFPFANGIGLMGEAGTEAVMPLRRGADGRLGVEASGGGSGKALVVNVHNAIDSRTDAAAIEYLIREGVRRGVSQALDGHRRAGR